MKKILIKWLQDKQNKKLILLKQELEVIDLNAKHQKEIIEYEIKRISGEVC